MHVTIQVWPDRSASLLLDDGTVEEAVAVCEQWLGHRGEFRGDGQDPSCASFY